MEEQKPKTIAEEAGLSDSWHPIDVAPIIPSQMRSQNSSATEAPFVGSLPPGVQQNVDFSATARNNGRGANLSLMPFAASGQSGVNSAIQSTTNLITGGGSGVELDTNGTLNPNQKRLNLTGVGVTVTNEADGTTTITGGGGDGLVHGNSVWWLDPAFTWFRDDFIGGSTGDIGELRWGLFGSPDLPAFTGGLSMANLGEFKWNNSAVASQVAYLSFLPAPGVGTRQRVWPLFDFPGWRATFIWRFHPSSDSSGTAANFSQKAMYVGFAFAASETSGALTRPTTFIGARYDTTATIADSTIKLEVVQNASSATNVRNNTQGTVIDTGITPAIDTYYRLDIVCTSAGALQMSINGAAPSDFTVITVTTTATSGAGSSVQAGGGLARLSVAAANGLGPHGAGSLVTVAGLLAGNAVLNGSHLIDTLSPSTNALFTFASSAVIGNNITNFTLTGYPALIPIIMFGNDTTAGPATDTCMPIDFFSFVWNKGLAGATNPDATLNRYW